MAPALLSHVGRDAEGDALVEACLALGLETRFLLRDATLPTDRYMAVEGANGVIAAIADAHSLETAGAKILRPLADGRLGPIAIAAVGMGSRSSALARSRACSASGLMISMV